MLSEPRKKLLDKRRKNQSLHKKLPRKKLRESQDGRKGEENRLAAPTGKIKPQTARHMEKNSATKGECDWMNLHQKSLP